MLNQCPAGRVHDAFRQTGRAGRVHDVQRMVEGQVGKSHGMDGRQRQIFPFHSLRQGVNIPVSRIIDHDNLFHRRELIDNSLNFFLGIDDFASKIITIGGKNYLGLYLAEAVKDAFDPKIRLTR